MPLGADLSPAIEKAAILAAVRGVDQPGWAALALGGWGVVVGSAAGPWAGPADGARWRGLALDGEPVYLHAERPRGARKGLQVIPMASVRDLTPDAWAPVAWPEAAPQVNLALAGPFGAIAEAWSGLTGVEPTAALTAALVSFSTALAGRVEIAIGDWTEHNPALWGMVSMPSGVRKSPLLELAIAPWWAYQARAVAEWTAARDVDDDDDEEGEAQPPAILVSDFTPASLDIALGSTPAVFLQSDEADEFFAAATRGDRVQLGPLLKGYSGARLGGVLRVTRRSRVAVDARARIGLLGLCQPSVLYGAAQRREFLDQGLLGRALWAVAHAPTEGDVARLERKRPGARADVEKRWRTMLGRIFDLPQVERGPAGDVGQPLVWKVSPKGERAILAFADECSAAAAPGAQLHDLQTWLRKAHGHAARLAATLAAADGLPPDGVIADDVVARAIALTRDFIAHARAAWQHAGWPPATDDARHLWLRSAALRREGVSTVRDVEEALLPGPEWGPARVDVALSILEDRGFVRLRRPKGARRPEAVEWNPLAT